MEGRTPVVAALAAFCLLAMVAGCACSLDMSMQGRALCQSPLRVLAEYLGPLTPSAFWMPVGLVGLVTAPAVLTLFFSSDGGSANGPNSGVDGPTLRLLYGSHVLSAWGDRMWQFALPVLLMEIFHDTLLPSALFSLIVYSGVAVTLPLAGSWVDREDRWKLFATALGLENAFIGVSTSLLVVLAIVDRQPGSALTVMVGGLAVSATTACTFGAMVLISMVTELMNQAQTLAIEKDWVVVIAKGNSDALQRMNTTMRRLDLSCKILAPLAIGVLLDFCGTGSLDRLFCGALTVGLFNIVAWPIEYLLALSVYERVPALKAKQHVHDSGLKHSHADWHLDHSHSQRTNSDSDSANSVSGGLHRASEGVVGTCSDNVSTYAGHPVFLASVAYCMLYMTVLDNGALMTSYLEWRSVPTSVLGASRGAGAVFGLLGTVLYPALNNWIGPFERTGLVSLWLFWLLLSPAAAAFVLMGESTYSDYAVLGSMVLSRCGLWSFDLAETQIMQEYVGENVRGSVNSMQHSLYQVLYVVIQGLGVYYHNPADFAILVYYSICVVFVAACTYSFWYKRHFGDKHPVLAS